MEQQNKEKQKQLLVEIMNEDDKNGLYEDISKKETTQTAVEFLFEQIQNGNITSIETKCGYIITILDNCVEQAKQMEKQQITDAYDDGHSDGCLFEKRMCALHSSEKYYKENYG